MYRRIRALFGVAERDYMLSLGPEQIMGELLLGTMGSLSELMSEGKSNPHPHPHPHPNPNLNECHTSPIQMAGLSSGCIAAKKIWLGLGLGLGLGLA